MEVGRPRVAVGHHHVGDRGAVEDRPLAPLVLVADRVEHEALAGREADPHPPALPAQLVARELEARPLRLADLDRLEPGARARRLRRVVGVLGRQRDDPAVLHRDHRHRVQVHDRQQVGHRPRVAIVLRVPPHPRERAHQPPPLVLREAEVARRPAVHHGEAQIGDPAPAHGFLPARVGADRRLAIHELVQHDGGLGAGHVLPRQHAAPGERHDRLVGLAGPGVHEHHERGPLHRVAGPVREHDLLGRLVQHDEDDPHPRPERALRPHDLPGARDLGRGQRIQGVDGRCHASSPSPSTR